MLTQSMTETEVNQSGAAAQLRYFSTTYGHTFGYNERARKYHRSYGLVTPPTNPAFSDYRLGDLATAPLFRRNHLGFRVDYPEKQFTWSASAALLQKNQKKYGDDDTANSPSATSASITSPSSSSSSSSSPSSTGTFGKLPPRRVSWRGAGALGSPEWQGPGHQAAVVYAEDSIPSQRGVGQEEFKARQQEFERNFFKKQQGEGQQQFGRPISGERAARNIENSTPYNPRYNVPKAR